MNLLRWWHTLRHLRPVQIWGRPLHWVRRRFCSVGYPASLSQLAFRLRQELLARVRPTFTWTFIGRELACPSHAIPWDAVRRRRFVRAGVAKPGAPSGGPLTDKLWRYHLNYFGFLFPRGRFTLDEERFLIADWLATNDDEHAEPWEPYVTARRIRNWVRWRQETRRGLHDQPPSPVEESLAAHPSPSGAQGVWRGNPADPRSEVGGGSSFVIPSSRTPASDGLTGADLATLVDIALWYQVKRLRLDLEHHLQGNHLLEDYAALCVGCLHLRNVISPSEPRARSMEPRPSFCHGIPGCRERLEAWLEEAASGLTDQVEAQILTDGGHEERSPMYHADIMDSLWQVHQNLDRMVPTGSDSRGGGGVGDAPAPRRSGMVLDRKGVAQEEPGVPVPPHHRGPETFPRSTQGVAHPQLVMPSPSHSAGLGPAAGRLRACLTEILPRMADWLGHLTHPDGRIALFQDSAFDQVPTWACPVDEAPPGPGAAGSIGSQFRAGPPRSASQGARGPFPIPGRPGEFWLSHSRYYVRRWGSGNYLAIDLGPPAPAHQPGHAHCGALSYELSVAGHRVVVDSGIGSYHEATVREQGRRTAAHNVPLTEGTEQSDIWGKFRLGRRARIDLLAHDPAAHRIEARLTDVQGNVFRRVITTTDHGMTVEDTRERAAGRGAFLSLLHLAPGLTVCPGEDRRATIIPAQTPDPAASSALPSLPDHHDHPGIPPTPYPTRGTIAHEPRSRDNQSPRLSSGSPPAGTEWSVHFVASVPWEIHGTRVWPEFGAGRPATLLRLQGTPSEVIRYAFTWTA